VAYNLALFRRRAVMSDPTSCPIARVRRWLEQVRVIADENQFLGQRARTLLPPATGLSSANVEWALTHAFETDATDDELQRLVASVQATPAAHVLLSANVFVGALRAIALAIASSATVYVRPSRRETVMATLLHDASPGVFEIVTELHPRPGEHLWAYGADSTVSELRTSLPRGVVLHGHGSGFGVLLVERPSQLTLDDFDAMALDIAAFDQRGCLSPRYVLLEADRAGGEAFARSLVLALNRAAERLPIGVRDVGALEDFTRHRELWRYLGRAFEGPGGLVTLDVEGKPWGRAPTHRAIHVRTTGNALDDLVGLAPAITAVGSSNCPELAARVLARVPRARWSPFGHMQRPKFDGAADRRTDPDGIIV
jgi:hypothetical protein